MSLTQHRLDIIDGQEPVKRDRFYNIEITDLEKRVSDLLQYCDSHRFSCPTWFILRVKHQPFEIEKSLLRGRGSSFCYCFKSASYKGVKPYKNITYGIPSYLNSKTCYISGHKITMPL